MGGADYGCGNFIAGNVGNGIVLRGSAAISNSVQGNTIGVAADGLTALPNLGNGILLEDASTNTIGGSADGAGNLISANGQDGIQIGAGVSNVVVAGNRIGLTAGGDGALGNAGDGIALFGPNNRIGGSQRANAT